jgi:ssRNA-specific RNase YbeY (16S rRNA maturation enzyme)
MLFELIYHSQAIPNLPEEEHKNILKVARGFNQAHGITGCLLFHKGQFLQLLEGEFEQINELYSKIRKDKRHTDVITLHMKEIENRIFDNWSMAYKAINEKSVIKQLTGVEEFRELPTEENESKESKILFNVMGGQLMNR